VAAEGNVYGSPSTKKNDMFKLPTVQMNSNPNPNLKRFRNNTAIIDYFTLKNYEMARVAAWGLGEALATIIISC
jgi:hypothetical protein